MAWYCSARPIWALLAILALATPGRPQTPAPQIDPTLFSGLHWRSIGPNRGGRSQAVAGSDSRPLEDHFGATGGGLWKTTDGGQTWRAVSDKFFKTSSVGAVAVAPSNADIVYVGMGETELRGNIIQGDGVYKSTDGGKTWTHVGLERTQTVARVRVHPTNPDVVFVAALGDPSDRTPNAVSSNPRTAASPGIGCCSATTRQALSIWRSIRKILTCSTRRCGRSSEHLTHCPAAGRAAACSRAWTAALTGRSSPATAFQQRRSERSASRSPAPTRTGSTPSSKPRPADCSFPTMRARAGGWSNEDRRLRQRAFYYTRIYADPQVKDTLYVVNTGVYRSTDAAKTIKSIRVPHGDNHDVWIASTIPSG